MEKRKDSHKTGEIRIDVTLQTPEARALAARQAVLVHRFNQAEPYSDAWRALMQEIFSGRLGEGSVVMSPLTAVRPHRVTIGRRSIVMSGALMMGAGGIEIGDDVQIAANVQLISNNHDPYDRYVITGRPVRVLDGAWVGAGSTLLPGVTVGRHAIVGAASVVTHDVPDYAVAVGNPARVIRHLDPERF